MVNRNRRNFKKTIAYYISDYGYGHAARSVAIIRELLEKGPSLYIIICHSFAIPFLKNSLPFKQVSIREVSTDIGYFLKKQSLEPDKAKLKESFDIFFKDWKSKMEKEEDFLISNKVDIVISDISPLPFEAATKAGIPSVGISNFTWYSAYELLLDKERLERLKQAYERMTSFFLLAGNNERNWLGDKRDFSFFSRKIEDEKVEEILDKVNPSRKKTVIFFGLGMKINHINVSSLPIWDSKDCVFIVSSNVRMEGDNVFSIPADETESQHYIAASDLVITKAGWGTVSEAVIYDVPLLLLNRDGMKEDQNTIAFVLKHALGEVMEWEEFLDFRYERGKRERKTSNGFRNQVDVIVDELLLFLF